MLKNYRKSSNDLRYGNGEDDNKRDTALQVDNSFFDNKPKGTDAVEASAPPDPKDLAQREMRNRLDGLGVRSARLKLRNAYKKILTGNIVDAVGDVQHAAHIVARKAAAKFNHTL